MTAELIAKHKMQDKGLTRFKWRVLLRQFHLFIGLSFGLLFSLMSVTGGLLVFEHEIDEWLNPALLISAQEKHNYRLDEILAAAQKYDQTFQPERLETPRTESGVFLLRGKHSVGAEQYPLDILIDPSNNEVLGSRVWGEYTMSFIYKLHYTLLLGKSGSTVVGIAGLMLFTMVITGTVLWWPKRGKWKQAFGIKWQAKPIRKIWDLHRSTGIFSALVLLVIALSGFYMTFAQYVNPVINLVSPLTPFPSSLVSQPTSSREQITLAEVANIAEATFPNTELKRIYFPKNENGVFMVTKREPHSVMKSSGNSHVWIDQYDGKVLAIRSADIFTAGDYFVALQFPLHNGEALGMPGRLLILLVSFAPLILFITGFWVWRRRSSVRR